MENNKFFGDYHTHTIYSHAIGTIEENVRQAVSMGLKEIAITDHGYKHFCFNVRRGDFSYMRREVEELKKKYNINIFLGMETNLLSNKGDTDLEKQDIPTMDIILFGYHKMVVPSSLPAFFSFYIGNLAKIKKNDMKRKKNTEAYLKAINRYPIDIVVHPKYGIDLDPIELAKECKRLGVYFELNGKRIPLTDDEMYAIIDTGVDFIAGSDAHTPNRVGEFGLPESFIEKFKIPPERIANFGKIPVFRSRRK